MSNKKLTFEEYQEFTRNIAIYPNAGKNYIYPTLGLAGEAGEVAEIVKKLIRDKNSEIDKETRDRLKKEIGDVLWYVSQVSDEFGIALEEVVKNNIEKLSSRRDRDKLHGEGDNR